MDSLVRRRRSTPDGGKPGLAADNNGVLLAVANPKPGSRKYSYWVHHGRVGNLQSLGWQEGNIWIPEEAVRAADIAFGRNETVNRDIDTGEALDEDVFSAIGDTATKFFGSKEGKRELFWRKQGKADAESHFDSVYGDRAEEDMLDKEDILHDAQTIFMDMKGNPKWQASKAVKAAVSKRRDSLQAYDDDRASAQATRDASVAQSKATRRIKAARQKKQAAERERKRKKDLAQQIKQDNIRGSYIPSAGFSTDHKRREENLSRRTNRGELEEGWFGLGKSKEEKAQAYFDRNWTKIEDMIGDDPGSQILDRVEKWLQEYPLDANDKGIQGAVENAIRYHKSDQERSDVESRFADRASKKKQRSEKEREAAEAEEAAADKKHADYLADLERRKQMDREDKIADIRGSYIPGAGQSTDHKRREENRSRRTNRGELEEGFKGYFTRKPKPHQLVNKLAYLLGDEDSMKASTLKGLMSLSFGLRSKDFLRGIWVSRKDKDAARKKMERTLPRTGFWKRIFKADPDEQDAYIDLMTEYAMDWLKSGHDKADMMPFLAKLIKAKAGDDIEKILDAGKSAEKQRRADSDKYASDQAAEREKNVAAGHQKEAVWEKISDKGYHSAVDGDDAELVANTLEAVYPGGLDLWITIANNSSSNKDIRHGQWDGHNARDRNWKKAQKQGRELMALNWSGMLPYKAAEKVKSIIHDFISARARPSYNDVEDAEERYQAQEKGHKNWQEGRETWSSYKDAQVLSENWRKYMSEDKKE